MGDLSRSRYARAQRDRAVVEALLAAGESALAAEVAARAMNWLSRNGVFDVDTGSAARFAALFRLVIAPAVRAA